MAGWYSNGMVDCHEEKVRKVENGRVVNSDNGKTRVVCDYCGKSLSYGERCNCEGSKW